MSDQEDFDQDLTPSQEHTIAFAVILFFGAMYLFFMKGCQPIASSIGQAFGPPQTAQVSPVPDSAVPPTGRQKLELAGDANKQQADASDNEHSLAREASTSAEAESDKAENAQQIASTDSEENTSLDQAAAEEKARAEAQARDAAKIKSEAASLAAATAAQKLADEKRFQAKQSELKAGEAELAIPAKPVETKEAQAKPEPEPESQNETATSQVLTNEEVAAEPFNMQDELARTDFTLPDGRGIQIPKQGFESDFKRSILQGDSGQPIVFDRITFFPGSDLLNPESSNQILGVAGIMNTYKDVNIKLRGHTDSSGPAEENLTLSFKRSQNLKNQLVGLGIDEKRISVEGLGASEPISDNSSEKGRNKNRRIDLTIIR